MDPVRIGVKLSQQFTDVAELRAIWQVADQAGFDDLWNFDHFAAIAGDPERDVIVVVSPGEARAHAERAATLVSRLREVGWPNAVCRGRTAGRTPGHLGCGRFAARPARKTEGTTETGPALSGTLVLPSFSRRGRRVVRHHHPLRARVPADRVAVVRRRFARARRVAVVAR
jgi:hypothetical protein